MTRQKRVNDERENGESDTHETKRPSPTIHLATVFGDLALIGHEVGNAEQGGDRKDDFGHGAACLPE
jgi:hypothetical protein